MLFRADGTGFALGRSRFFDGSEGHFEQTAKIFVRIEPAALGAVVLAQLDTAAPWLVLNTDVAEMRSLFDGEGPEVTLSTRRGTVTGRLEQTMVSILADEGDSLEFPATVFASRDWTGGTFLGYSGFLERIRFAVDPQENFFYFGPAQTGDA